MIKESNGNTLMEEPIFKEDDPYQILGITEKSNKVEIKKAYIKLIKTYKPETHPEEFKKIRQAYEDALDWSEYASYQDDDENENKNSDDDEGKIVLDPSLKNTDDFIDDLTHQEQIDFDFPGFIETFAGKTNLDLIDNDKIQMYDNGSPVSDKDESDLNDSGFDNNTIVKDQIELYQKKRANAENFADIAYILFEAILDDPDIIEEVYNLLSEDELSLFLDLYPYLWETIYEVEDYDNARLLFEKTISDLFLKQDHVEILEIINEGYVIEWASNNEQVNDYVSTICSSLLIYFSSEIEATLENYTISEKYKERFEYGYSTKSDWLKWQKKHQHTIINDIITMSMFAPINDLKEKLTELFNLILKKPLSNYEPFNDLKKHDLDFLFNDILDLLIKNQNLIRKSESGPGKFYLKKLENSINKHSFADLFYGLLYLLILGILIFSIIEWGWWGLFSIIPTLVLFVLVAFKHSKKMYYPERAKIVNFIIQQGVSPDDMYHKIKAKEEVYTALNNIKEDIRDDAALAFIAKIKTALQSGESDQVIDKGNHKSEVAEAYKHTVKDKSDDKNGEPFVYKDESNFESIEPTANEDSFEDIEEETKSGSNMLWYFAAILIIIKIIHYLSD